MTNVEHPLGPRERKEIDGNGRVRRRAVFGDEDEDVEMAEGEEGKEAEEEAEVVIKDEEMEDVWGGDDDDDDPWGIYNA